MRITGPFLSWLGTHRAVMRRLRRIALWTLGLLLGIPAVLVLALLLFANTSTGRNLIEQQTASLTGGSVRISGLSGSLPQALRLDRLELADAHGTYFTAEHVALDWSPLALLGGTFSVQRLAAANAALARLPVAAPAKPGAKPFSLPVRVTLRALDVPRAELGAPVAGEAAVLKLAGSANVISLAQGSLTLAIERLDSPGSYRIEASLAADGGVAGRLAVHEPAHGLIGSIAKLPDLRALAIQADLTGPKTREQAELTASAGPLRAVLHGDIDLTARTLSLDTSVSAPAMAPGPGLAWQSVALTAHAHGPWKAPEATAHLAIAGLAAGRAGVASLTADLAGDRGHLDLTARLTGTRIPGPQPQLFAAPLDVAAHAELAAPTRPVTFRLTDRLLTASGEVETAGPQTLRMQAAVPDLAPLATVAGVRLGGSAAIALNAVRQGGETAAKLAGRLDVTGGQAPIPGLLGATTLTASARMAGQDITLESLKLDGSALRAELSGRKTGVLDLAWRVGLSDLSVLSAQARGALTADGTVTGPMNDLTVAATLSGDVGGAALRPGRLTASLHATGLPGTPEGQVQASGVLAGAPLSLAADAARDAGGTLHATISRASWKSFAATARLALAKGATIPLGRVDAKAGNLGDLSGLTGQTLAGSLTASLVTSGSGPAPVTRIDVVGQGLGVAGSRLGRLAITGHVTGADADPDLDVALAADGIESGAITGSARAQARGRADALALAASAGLQNVAGQDLTASTSGVLDARAKSLRLQTLAASSHGLALQLLAPARLDFGAQTRIDRLLIGVGDARIELAGQVSPTLSVTASVRNVTPALARPFVPGLDAAGVVNAEARLSGTAAAPVGAVRLQASGLRLRTGPAAAIPAASLTAAIGLDGRTARIDARVDAGPKLHLAADGTAPLKPSGALDLRSTGFFDLTLLNSVLEAEGRRATGKLDLDILATGPLAQPQLSGSARLANGMVQDYAEGLHLTGIAARIDAAGSTLRVALSAQAGKGTLAASGTVGIAAPMRVDLHFTAAKAQPLASDLLTATLDADLRAQGQVQGALDVAGRIKLLRADINIPDSFPPSVAVLNVRRAGQKPPPPARAAPPSTVRLAIELSAPEAIFVRGHGLDAELGGTIHVRGTSTEPQISGGFEMRRGDFSLAGTSLEFTKGMVSFNGAGITGKIDPSLDFEADSFQGGITATLTITGYADAPKIGLSSVPELPQDEVLAHLLFGQSMASLSPLQIAEIGAALAEISGLTGGGGGPLSSIRKGLGLDRLSIGGGTNGAGASVQAGRYVARGVYVGAAQATSGAGGTQAQVQVDLTKRLKLTTQLGTGGSTQGATPQNDPGSSVGLAYQFEY